MAASGDGSTLRPGEHPLLLTVLNYEEGLATCSTIHNSGSL